MPYYRTQEAVAAFYSPRRREMRDGLRCIAHVLVMHGARLGIRPHSTFIEGD